MTIPSIQRHSSISLFSRVILTVVGFVSTIYFAHALGPEILGVYFQFIAYFTLFNLISDLGLGNAAIKRISEGSEQNEYFSAYFSLRIITTICGLLVLIFIGPYISNLNQYGFILWLALFLIVAIFFNSIAVGVYGLGKVGINQITFLINEITRIIFQIGAIFLGYALFGLNTGFIIGMLVAGIFGLQYFNLKLTRFELHHIQRLFWFSIWISLSAAGVLVFSYADTILIGYFLTNEDVGIYRIAFQLTGVATFTTLALYTTLYPKISEWGLENRQKIEITLSRAFTYSLLLAIPVAVGGWILGDRLLILFYGADFSAGTCSLMILLFVQIVNVFMYLQTMCLNAIDRPRESFYATGTAAIVNILLDLALIPLLGIEGAAIATLLTMIINSIIAYHYLSRYISVRIEHRPTLHILLAAGGMAFVILIYRLFIPLSNVFLVLVAVPIGGLIFFIILLKIDQDLHNEIRILVEQLGLRWPRWL